jgi:hypothetical protein
VESPSRETGFVHFATDLGVRILNRDSQKLRVIWSGHKLQGESKQFVAIAAGGMIISFELSE